MKKLTPFQKKVARWAYRKKWRENIFVWMGSTFLLAFPTTPFFLAAGKYAEFNQSAQGIASVFWISLLVLSVCLSGVSCIVAIFGPIFWIDSAISRLPEKASETANKFLEDHSEYAQKIQELIQKAYIKDDGGELQTALEKFKTLAGKEKYLADLPKQAEKLKTEIAALEKELGL